MVEKYLVATQIAMGGVDWLVCRISVSESWKLAATALSGGFLLLQIASYSGYVQTEWKKVEKGINQAKRQVKKQANKAAPEISTITKRPRNLSNRTTL